jgi:hypothetical protein
LVGVAVGEAVRDGRGVKVMVRVGVDDGRVVGVDDGRVVAVLERVAVGVKVKVRVGVRLGLSVGVVLGRLVAVDGITEGGIMAAWDDPTLIESLADAVRP